MKKEKSLEDEILLSTAEVAAILDVSRTLVCRHIKRKNIPVIIDRNDSMMRYLITPIEVEGLIYQLSKTKQKKRLEKLKEHLASSRLIYRSMIDENYIE